MPIPGKARIVHLHVTVLAKSLSNHPFTTSKSHSAWENRHTYQKEPSLAPPVRRIRINHIRNRNRHNNPHDSLSSSRYCNSVRSHFCSWELAEEDVGYGTDWNVEYAVPDDLSHMHTSVHTLELHDRCEARNTRDGKGQSIGRVAYEQNTLGPSNTFILRTSDPNPRIRWWTLNWLLSVIRYCRFGDDPISRLLPMMLWLRPSLRLENRRSCRRIFRCRVRLLLPSVFYRWSNK